LGGGGAAGFGGGAAAIVDESGGSGGRRVVLPQVTHAYFPHNHPYNITSVILTIDLLYCRSNQKSTNTSFFT